jgi:peptidoglycan/LPS O-acetylase OafA/YrhL
MTVLNVREPQASRFWTLDVVRGLAILGVVIFHVVPHDGTIKSEMSWLRYLGPLGVSLFFVLSGFSIHLSQLRKGKAIQSWPQFFRRRFGRLYLPYLGAIILALTINVTWSLCRGRNPTALLPSPTDLIAHLLLLHTLHPQTFFGIIPALWFVGVVAHLYLLYPLFLRLTHRCGENYTLLIVLLITVVVRLLCQSLTPLSASPELTSVFQNNAPQRWFEWCFGAWIATRVTKKDSPSLLLSGLSLMFFIIWLSGSIFPCISEPLLGACLGTLIWNLVNYEDRMPFHQLWLPLFHIGQISYSIYLVHQVFVPYVRSAIEPSPFAAIPTLLLTSIGVLLVTLPLSLLFYYIFEKSLIFKISQYVLNRMK